MGGAGANATSPTLQWIEFKADEVVAFDGRESKLLAEFSEDVEPKRLSLRHQTIPSPDTTTDWRYGIYRLDRDRLILCWTNGQTPLPTEFAGDVNGFVQLLVLRREWNPPAEYQPKERPPPRAVIPFTAFEATLLQKAWADAVDVGVETTNSLGMTLRLLPPGSFDPTGAERLKSFPSPSDQVPPVGANISQPVYIATKEVTVAQFRKFVEATEYETTAERMPPESGNERHTWHHSGIVQDSDQHPVVHVSWQDAQAFCRWLSDTEQQQYRLPTITEWAFAARAGTASSTPLKLPHNARLRFFDTTAPVGGDKANLFGLHDLFGNVSEWANDNMGAVETGGGFGGAGADGLAKTYGPRHRHFAVTALGGGYRSTRKRDDGTEWMLPLLHGDTGHLDDMGFRVARVVTRDVEVLSGYWPPVESLMATATQATISSKADRTKTTDPKTPLDDSAKERPTPRPVIALRGLVPIGSFPLAPNVLDFEVERAREVTTGFDVGPGKDAWSKVDLTNSLKLLEQSDYAPDSVPGLLANPAFTMPLLQRADTAWPKELVTHPQLPLTPPKSKYEVQQQLFRFFDFNVMPGYRYAYRVRLKFTPPGKQEKPPEIFTPWSTNSNWVAVE
ncbi:MAG: SUMF1/EgtB/PvdO family nonheme iron enzyme, partial [Planctomycetaceae bacterium]|nr:SUMF1/EgtB/PvdO family nonheme iron enzyme [Planctomycetaceae bacterium]